MVPSARYAKSGGVNVAYQVIGTGPPDLLMVPGWVSHVEYAWEEPLYAAFLRRLAGVCRLSWLDRRGTGLSDPVPRLPTLEERMDDVRAVMDAVGIERASLLGVSEGGPMCMLFAATYPERTDSLILYGTFPAQRRSLGLPWGHSDESLERFLDLIDRQWGQGVSATLFAPSMAEDEAFVHRWGRMERMAVSPASARAMLEVAVNTDVRDVLASIRVPTLILHRVDDRAVPIDAARHLAAHIPGARLVELPGSDHLPFVGDTEPLLGELEEFLTGRRQRVSADRVLATVLFVDIVESTARAAELGDARWRTTLEQFRQAVGREIERFGGRAVSKTGDGLLARFDGPARAIHAAAAARTAVRALSLRVRAGVHTGECELMGDDLGGLAVHIGARVMATAAPGEILVSSTVRELVVGSDLNFTDRGAHELKGVPGQWRLYAVTDGGVPPC